MIEATGNLWTFKADIHVITTNGTVKKNGEAVMGRGCAYEATQKWPGLARELGTKLKEYGNELHYFDKPGGKHRLLTFPVKHEWWEKADPELIQASTEKLCGWLGPDGLLNGFNVVMPRPGCGNGKLRWDDVRPLLLSLPDNVTVITFKE